jgi:capsular polysaccharide transport system permease protein
MTREQGILDATVYSSDAHRLRSTWRRRLRRRFDFIFVVTVLLPTLIAIAYFGFIASDVYISESRFVVRSPQRQTPTGLGALLQGSGFSRSQDDTYLVNDYIRSRDALKELDQTLGIRAKYSESNVDFINRFPGIGFQNSFEDLYRHYLKHVTIDYDSVSSISVLRVRAYRAEDAQRINTMLLQMGERLVNNLNRGSRQDLIETAEQEVRAAEERSKAAAMALSSFRADRGVFDPDRQSTLQLQTVARLQEELLATEGQLAQVRQLAPNNSQIPVIAARVEVLRRAIEAESAKVTGRGTSLTSKSPIFDRLVLEKGFADRQLASALAAMDTARNDAQRKQSYLERLVQPNLPDMALEPRRLRSVLMVFLLGLIVWGVVSLVAASVREHTD